MSDDVAKELKENIPSENKDTYKITLQTILSTKEIKECIFSYLDLESLTLLSQVNKFYKNNLINQTTIFQNEIRNKRGTLAELVFKKNYYFDIVNKEVLEELWVKTDKVYKYFWNRNQTLLVVYFFSILIGIDLQAFLIAFFTTHDKYTTSTFSRSLIIFMPLIILWILSVIILIIYKVRFKKNKKQCNEIIEDYKAKEKLKYLTQENLENLRKSMAIRSSYCENSIFEKLLLGIITLLFPFFIKQTLIFKVKVNYYNTYLIMASVFFIFSFSESLLRLAIKKYKQYKNSIGKEFKEYANSDCPNEIVFSIKASKTMFSSPLSDFWLTFLYYIMKVIFSILVILYLSEIGAKLDNPYSSSSWQLLFIPIYIFGLLGIAYGVIHVRSIIGLYKTNLFINLFTIISGLVCYIVSICLAPLQFTKKFHSTFLLIPCLLTGGSIFVGIHFTMIYTKIKNT